MSLSEDFDAMLSPKVVEGGAFERSRVDDALGLVAVDELPRLADGFARWEAFAEQAFESTAAPHPFHGDGFKTDGLSVFHDDAGGR